MLVYVHAGLLEPEDFVLTETLDEKLLNAYKALKSDPNLAALTPVKKNFEAWPEDAKLNFILLAQMVMQQQLLDIAELG